jgi:hypothetical protein
VDEVGRRQVRINKMSSAAKEKNKDTCKIFFCKTGFGVAEWLKASWHTSANQLSLKASASLDCLL